MKKVIPEQTMYTCDACGCTLSGKNWRAETNLYVRRHALDMQGMACANASYELDLCDRCEVTITGEINAAILRIRNGTPS